MNGVKAFAVYAEGLPDQAYLERALLTANVVEVRIGIPVVVELDFSNPRRFVWADLNEV